MSPKRRELVARRLLASCFAGYMSVVFHHCIVSPGTSKLADALIAEGQVELCPESRVETLTLFEFLAR